MEYVDLSHTLDSSTPIYPGDPTFSCCPALTLGDDGVNVQTISLGSHTGTHVDAPYHFIASGQRIDDISLSEFIGPALVIDATGKNAREKITWQDVEPFVDSMRAAQGSAPIVLIRTGWSQYWGTAVYFDHPYLDRDAAVKLVDAGVKTIGIDTLSPDETFTNPELHGQFDVHHIILGAGGIIAENLTNLDQIQDGFWVINMVPLKIGGSDGSPVRAFAWRPTVE